MDGKEIHEVLRRADEALTIQGSYRAPEQARILAARDIVRDAMNDPALSTIDPEAILADEPKEREDTKTWSNYEIGMLAAMMTGDIEKDWATLATYLRDEPNDIPKCTRPLDMECHAHSGDNCYNGFQCDPISDEPNECEAEIGDIVAWANSQGKPIVGQYGNEITQGDAIILMRRSEVERKLKERDGLLCKSDVDDRGEG